MGKTWIGIVGILACAASPLCADGFSENDRALIAGKGVFPGEGSEDEGALPEADMTDDSGDTTPMPAPGTSNDSQTEKDVIPEVKSGRPSGGKDIFPPEAKSPAGKAN